MPMKYKLILLFLLFPILLMANKPIPNKPYEPWYTGPLLCTSGTNLAKGQICVQPYYGYGDSFVKVDKSWSHHAQPNTITNEGVLYLQAGITNWLDVTAIFECSSRKNGDQKAFGFGDIGVRLGFQIVKEKEFTLLPSIRLTIKEIFPNAKYNNLNPNKFGIDAFGSGCYDTKIGIAVSKIVYFVKKHPICWYFNLDYYVSTNVNVKGFNSYGGGFNAKGKVNPGNSIVSDFSFEFSLTQRWVYAMDFYYVYVPTTKFKGYPGLTQIGTLSINSFDRAEALFLSPCIEYNFTNDIGIIVGTIFSMWGKNITPLKAYAASVTFTF